MIKFLLGFILFYTLSPYTYADKNITCSTAEFQPYVIDGIKIKGIDLAIIDMIAKRLKWKIQYKTYPWARLMALAKNGDINCLFSAAFQLKRSKFLDYTTIPIHTTTYYIFSNAKYNLTNIQSIKNKVIGIHRGYTFPEPLSSMIVKKELVAVEAKTEDELFKMLALNRIDLVLTDKKVGDYYSSHIKNIMSFPLNHAGLRTYLTFKKGYLSEEELNNVNKALNKVMQDRVFMADINYKYTHSVNHN
jgi:ABC-type amino acid transport substrate-binding protein